LKTSLVRVYRPTLGGNIFKLNAKTCELNPNKIELGGKKFELNPNKGKLGPNTRSKHR
jgi:hypothetical protein